MTYTNSREDILQLVDERNEARVVDVDPKGVMSAAWKILIAWNAQRTNSPTPGLPLL